MEAQKPFQVELITRFFNPKSYFFRCLCSALKAREDSIGPVDIQLIGLFIDELINAEDKIKKLKEYAQIDGIQHYYRYLISEVNRLKESRLSPEEMMKSVEDLAHTMADTLVEIAKEGKLKEILGVRVEKEAPSQPRTLDEQPWLDFKRDTAERLKHIKDLIENARGSSDPDVLKELSSSFRAIGEGAMICGLEGIEAIVSRISKILNGRALPPETLSLLTTVTEAIDSIINSGREEPEVVRRVLARIEDELRPAPEAQESISEPEEQQPPPEEEDLEEELLSQIKEIISPQEDELTESIEKPPLERVSGLESVSQEETEKFKEEGEFYFMIIDKALQKLQQEIKDKGAWEDVELACYSLKILAKKLNLEPIGDLCQLIETTATDALCERIDLTRDALETIAEAVDCIKSNGSPSDLRDIRAKLKEQLSKEQRDLLNVEE